MCVRARVFHVQYMFINLWNPTTTTDWGTCCKGCHICRWCISVTAQSSKQFVIRLFATVSFWALQTSVSISHCTCRESRTLVTKTFCIRHQAKANISTRTYTATPNGCQADAITCRHGIAQKLNVWRRESTQLQPSKKTKKKKVKVIFVLFLLWICFCGRVMLKTGFLDKGPSLSPSNVPHTVLRHSPESHLTSTPKPSQSSNRGRRPARSAGRRPSVW